MTIKEYCAATGTTPERVYQWIFRGLPHTPAKKIEIDRDTVDAWKASRQKQQERVWMKGWDKT